MIGEILNDIEKSLTPQQKIDRAENEIARIDWSIRQCNTRLERYANENKWDWAETEYKVRDRLLVERYEQMQIVTVLRTAMDQKEK